jgi:hypothetical protein
MFSGLLARGRAQTSGAIWALAFGFGQQIAFAAQSASPPIPRQLWRLLATARSVRLAVTAIGSDNLRTRRSTVLSRK